MKKVLSVILIALMLSTSVLTGVSVFAEEADYTVEKYNMVEISLISAKKYENPYTDVDIDAVFTHEDGTQIKTPGFWKESTKWAVRFTPNKTGKWTYTVTATDASNEKLNVSGTVLCTENDGSTEFEKHGFVKIKENSRYFVYDDGTPFFWLGDTNWQAPNYVQTDACNYPGCRCGNQFKHEVDNRLAKGFNVYQTYFDSSESDGGGQKGKLPSLWTKKFTLPSAEVFNDKIDYMFEYLYENGMVAALGFGVHTSTANNIKEEDLLRFVRYIVARYSCYSIAWISGQEITNNQESLSNPGRSALDMYMAASSLVDELDGYNHPNGAHMYPMKTTDERAQKLDNSSWHQWWAVQAGHGRTIQAKSFYQSYFLSQSGKIKPYVEAEANYEDINCGGFTGYDANRYSAWSALMNGTCGFTYGVAGIWANCYSSEGNTGWFGPSSYSYEPWYMGLDKPGSFEVKYMKEFFERLPWQNLLPRFYNKFYADFAASEDKYILSTDDRTTSVAYFRNNSLKTGVIKNLDATKTYKAYWFNTLTGKYIFVGDVSGETYAVPEKPSKNDWVFLLTTEDLGNLPMEEAYTEPEKAENIGNIVTPYEVTAVGGVFVKGGKTVDDTSLLYDMKGEAAWEPLADRVTQTIIYDLGAKYSLTQINIVPATDTILPKMRIEGSNDGVSWTIISDATFRDQNMSKDGKYVEEALQGNYRYVKVLILNAKDIPAEEAKEAKYMVTYNEANTKSYYSHTAIAEISVFSSGLAPEELEIVEGGENTDMVLPLTIGGGALILGAVVGAIFSLIITKKKKEEN